jgi:hypothetical protein
MFSITYLDHRNLLFRCVVAGLVSFHLRQNAKKCRVAVRHPMPEGKSANKDSDPGEAGIEQVEGTDRTHADEVKDRAFDTQVSQRLVQALEDAIGSFVDCFCVSHVASSGKEVDER